MNKAVAFFLLLFPFLVAFQPPLLTDIPFSCDDSPVSCEMVLAQTCISKSEEEPPGSWDALSASTGFLVSLHAWRITWLTSLHDPKSEKVRGAFPIRAPPLT